jgi:hypothetical protein
LTPKERETLGVAPFAVGVGIALLATFVPAFWLLWDFDATIESKAFVSTPQFVVWLLVLSGQAAVWVGASWLVVPTLVRRWRDLRDRDAMTGGALAAVVVLVLLLALVPIFLLFGPRTGIFGGFESAHVPSGKTWPLSHHELKVTPLVTIALLIGLLAIAGMWLTAIAFRDLAHEQSSPASRVPRFLALHSELTTLLAVAGVLVGLATLSSGALRETVLAANDEPVYREKAVACLAAKVEREDAGAADSKLSVDSRIRELMDTYPECRPLVFDRLYVLAYGLLFSAMLAIAFAPSLLAMRHAGARVRDGTFPLPDATDPDFFAVVDKRQKLDSLLQTNLSANATFKAGVAIATPLAASLISTVLPS